MAASVPLQERWDLIRSIFLDRIWLGILVIALLSVPASVSRAFFTGWKPVYAIHMVFLVCVVATWLLRRRLSFNVRAIIAIVLMNLGAIAGVTNFGLLGSAWWWLFIAALVGSTVYSLRIGIILTVSSLVILCGAGLAFINGWLVLSFDANTYVLQYSSWLTLLLGPVMLTIFVFWAISTYQVAALELLREVDKRREQRELLILQLQQALDEIKTLRASIQKPTS